MKVDRIDVVFENCESIEIPYEDVRFISLWGIRENVWDNNILYENSFEFKFNKKARGMRLIIKDKEEYQRITQYSDITHVDFMSGGKSIAYIGIEWVEGSGEYSNLGQKVSLPRKGEINILIDQTDFTNSL